MQRKPLTGRPSGTDGSDFSYRMVVDSRYTKVAKGKSRLKSLIFLQIFSQVIGLLCMLSSAKEQKELNRFAVISSSIGFMSLLVGVLGRRKSVRGLLKLYVILSSVAILLSAASIAVNDSFLKAIQDKNFSSMKSYQYLEPVHVLVGFALQVSVTITTSDLVHDMSPERSS